MNYQTIINPATLADNLHTPNWLILDCRGTLLSDSKGYHSYANSHIPSAFYCSLEGACFDIPRPNVCNYLPSEPIQMIEKLGEWGFNETTQIVIYEDLNSPFTDSIWLKVRSLGLKNVAVLLGGFASWRDYGYPTTLDGDKFETTQLLNAG